MSPPTGQHLLPSLCFTFSIDASPSAHHSLPSLTVYCQSHSLGTLYKLREGLSFAVKFTVSGAISTVLCSQEWPGSGWICQNHSNIYKRFEKKKKRGRAERLFSVPLQIPGPLALALKLTKRKMCESKLCTKTEETAFLALALGVKNTHNLTFTRSQIRDCCSPGPFLARVMWCQGLPTAFGILSEAHVSCWRKKGLAGLKILTYSFRSSLRILKSGSCKTAAFPNYGYSDMSLLSQQRIIVITY